MCLNLSHQIRESQKCAKETDSASHVLHLSFHGTAHTTIKGEILYGAETEGKSTACRMHTDQVSYQSFMRVR